MSLTAPRRLVWVVVSVALVIASPLPASAADPITPDSANSARFGVEQDGTRLRDSGAFEEAADLYWREGVRLKDPVLIIDSAEALRDQAAAERSIDAANSAIERVAPALDMLYFASEGSPSADWQPIAQEHLATVIERAEAVITDANELIATIEEEQRKAAEAAAAPPEPTKPARKAKPGTGLIAGGSAALIVGIGGVGLGAAGLGLGAKAQGEVEDPLVYEPEHSAAAQRGQTANVLAGVGFALAGVGVGLGIALIAVGVKKRKRAGESSPAASAAVVPVWLGDADSVGAGLGVVGRF